MQNSRSVRDILEDWGSEYAKPFVRPNERKQALGILFATLKNEGFDRGAINSSVEREIVGLCVYQKAKPALKKKNWEQAVRSDIVKMRSEVFGGALSEYVKQDRPQPVIEQVLPATPAKQYKEHILSEEREQYWRERFPGLAKAGNGDEEDLY